MERIKMLMTRGKDDEKALYDLLGNKDERKKFDTQLKKADSSNIEEIEASVIVVRDLLASLFHKFDDGALLQRIPLPRRATGLPKQSLRVRPAD